MKINKGLIEKIMTLGDIAAGSKTHKATATLATGSTGALVVVAVAPYLEDAINLGEAALLAAYPVSGIIVAFAISFLRAAVDRRDEK